MASLSGPSQRDHDSVLDSASALRAVIIHNRTAGHALSRERQFLQALTVLANAGWEVAVEMTSREGHATDIAREAASAGADVVIAAGGDGTVNEVIQGLAHTSTCMGCLPLGTVNVWSREAGYSSNIAEAARQLAAGNRVNLDLGRVGERYFLLMAGVGLDAEIAASLGRGRLHKQQLGIVPYIIRAARILPRYRGAWIELDMDGDRVRHKAIMVLISNTRLYGGIARPIPEAVANDGMLDVRVFPGNHLVNSIKHVVAFLLNRPSPGNLPNSLPVQRLTINAEPPLAIQVDGDPIGTTPVVIEVAHHALCAIVPKNYDRTLISSQHD